MINKFVGLLLILIATSVQAKDGEDTRRDIYSAILKHMSWILTEHLESASEAYMPFLSEGEVMTWDWSVRQVLDGITWEEVQLDDSERPEVIIQTHARTLCGSGGCNAHILKLDGDEPSHLGSFFYNGKLIPPVVSERLKPDSGFYEFAVHGSHIDIYQYDPVKREYRIKR